MEIIKASLMAAAMKGGGGGNLGSLSVTENGTYTPQSVHADVDGWNQVTVNVPTGGDTDPIFEYILQHITYFDGQLAVGQYTYKIGWLWADNELFNKTGAVYQPSSSQWKQYIVAGDDSTTGFNYSVVGTKYYVSPPSSYKYLYYFTVLFKGNTAQALWLNTTKYSARETYVYWIQRLYVDAKVGFFLENGQECTAAEYYATANSSTPHEENGKYYFYKSRELVLNNSEGTFTYSTSAFTMDKLKNNLVPITITFSYEIDYNSYEGRPPADSSLEKVAQWGADWAEIWDRYGSRGIEIFDTFPPRPVINSTGIQASATNQTQTTDMALKPSGAFYGIVSREELTAMYNEIADGVTAMMSTSDDIEAPLVTPPYVQE